MLDIQFFRTPFATVTKSYRGSNGEMYVEGVASTTNLDQTKERMSPEAINIMAAKFAGKPLNSEHHNDWDDNLGKIIESKVIDKDGKPALWIKAKLNDWLTRSKDLFNALNDGHLELGFSVEGKINPGGLVKEFDPQLGYNVPVYRDIEPAAVAVTNKPANLDTFCEAVTKSIKVEDLPEMRSGSYILVKKVLDGETIGESIEKDGKVIIQRDMNLDGNNTPVMNPTLDCGHSVCSHGQCVDKTCKNVCKICTTAKAVDIVYAGGIPHSGLARQDIHEKDETKTEAQKATPKPAEVVANPKNPKEAPGEEQANNSNLYNPPSGKYCTHDYCEHGNCMEGACPNKCSACSTRQELKDGENKIPSAPAANTATVGKDVTNAHRTKPEQYKDVPDGKFLDAENYKYPADEKHLKAALSYFNHDGQRSAGGYSPDKWATMGHKLAGFLGEGYHYDADSEKVVHSEAKKTTIDTPTEKSIVKGGDEEEMNQKVLQKSPYSQEVLDIIKAWGGNNPGNQELIAKANASAVSAGMTTPQAQVQPQQTVQKGSSSSNTSYPSSSSDTSTGSSTSSDSSTGSSSDSTSTGSSSSGDSLSSLLSSVLTTLSDMKSTVSGSSSGSSSDSSTGSSTSTSDKTSTDKALSSIHSDSGSNEPTKTSTDKALSDATDSTGSDVSDYGEATKALSLALANFQAALEKAKQPHDGKYAENGTQHAGAAKEGADSVNGKPQEADYHQEARAKHPMPKADTGSSDNVNGKPQEPDYNSLATKSVVANQEKFVKSIDTMIALMTKIGEKVEAVEGKVEAMPGVRKGIAIDKQFTEEEKAELVKNEQARKDIEAKLIADPRADFKALHQFRTYNVLPAWFQQ